MWLSAFQTARETFVNFFPSTEKFWFCTDKTGSIRWPSPCTTTAYRWLFRDFFTKNFVICLCQVTKLFCPRYSFTSSPSARSACNYGSLADLAILVFWEVNTNTMLSWCHFCRTFRIWVVRTACGCWHICDLVALCEVLWPFGNTLAAVSSNLLVAVSRNFLVTSRLRWI